jgi:hypothetical protein
MELVAVLVIFLIASSLAWATKIDIAYLFAPAIFLISGWEFIFGLLGYLNLGMESLLLFIGATLIASFIISGDFRRHLQNSICAPSTHAFIVLSIISLYKSKDWVLSQWDEFTHWGAVVKAMFHFATLGPAAPVDLVVPGYPPGISLIQYFVMDFSTGWREGLLFWSVHLIAIAIIVSVLANASYRYRSEVILKLFIAFLATSVFFNNFDTIYADPTLALAFGFLLFVAIQASYLDGRWAVLLALAAGFVTLSKPVGIYFAAAAILINAVAAIFPFKFYSVRKMLLSWVPAIAALFTSSIFWIAWRLFAKNATNSRDIVSLPQDLAPPQLNGGAFSNEVITNYLRAFFQHDMNPAYSVPLTPFAWTLICSLLFVIWVLLNGKQNYRKNLAIGVTILFTTVGYFMVVLQSYLTIFGAGEATGLASYSRYIGTWYQGIVLAIIFLILSEFSLPNFLKSEEGNGDPSKSLGTQKRFSLFLSTFIAITTLSSMHNYMLMLSVSRNQGSEVRAPLIPILEAVENAKMPEGSRVWIITQHTVGFEYYVLRYEMQNSRYEFGEKPFSIGTPYGDTDMWTAPDRTLEKWSDELIDWDYIVFYQSTESFNKQFAALFESGSAESNSVYKVKIAEDEVSLVKVS